MTHEPEDASEPALSVIVPVHNSAATVRACLSAIRATANDTDEIIVVDDASTDGGVPPQETSVTYIVLDKNVGRGPARNLGARQARGDVLVFVDSDVVLHDDALDAIRAAFRDHPERASLIGAYDDRPGHRGLVSQYRNLLHHRVHHTSGKRAVHFWTGIGAVRRRIFTDVGGLDETDWAHDMEDVEFGHRLVDEGYVIDVLPHVQGTHLKHFSLRSMVSTDVGHRAIPWSSLMLRTGFRKNNFVLSPHQTLSVAAATGTVVAAAGTVVAGTPVAIVLGSALCFVVVNAPLWVFLARKRSVPFAVGCIPLHFLHSLSSGVGFTIALGMHAERVLRTRYARTPDVLLP